MKENDINKNEPWIDHLKNKLENYSDQTPMMQWDKLEKDLYPINKPISKIKPLWKMAAAAILIAAISTIGLYLIHSPQFNSVNETIVEIVDQHAEILTPSPAILPTNNMAQVSEPHHKLSPIQTKNSESNQVERHENILENNEDTNRATTVTDKESNMIEKEVSPEKSNQNNTTKRKPSTKDKYHLPNKTDKTKRKNKASIGVGIGNAGNFALNKNIGFSESPSRINVSDLGMMDIPTNHTLVFNEGIPYLLRNNEIINTKHHQPITAGLSFKYPIKHGFSIETGINFTLLSSDITLADNIYTSHKQKLYYLGIPLKAIWDFLNTRYVTLYVAAGGQIEKCIYGKFDNNKIDERPLQFSIMGGLGAQFNITRQLGMYLEPGVAYYFNDNSSLKTIRNEHPFNFNLQAGLRFTY